MCANTTHSSSWPPHEGEECTLTLWHWYVPVLRAAFVWLCAAHGAKTHRVVEWITGVSAPPIYVNLFRFRVETHENNLTLETKRERKKLFKNPTEGFSNEKATQWSCLRSWTVNTVTLGGKILYSQDCKYFNIDQWLAYNKCNGVLLTKGAVYCTIWIYYTYDVTYM